MKTSSTEATLDDEQLTALIAQREESALAWHEAQDACRRLYDRHARLLLAFLASRLRRDNLEDVHQAVWQRVWEHLPKGFHGGNFRGWLYQIARNCVIDHHRRKPLKLLSEQELHDQSADDDEEPLAEQEQSEILRHCLERLDAEKADLVRSRLAGEDYDAICARLGFQPARAHKLFHQAKEELRNCVQKAFA